MWCSKDCVMVCWFSKLPLSLAQFLALVFRIFGNPVSADISNIDDLGVILVTSMPLMPSMISLDEHSATKVNNFHKGNSPIRNCFFRTGDRDYSAREFWAANNSRIHRRRKPLQIQKNVPHPSLNCCPGAGCPAMRQPRDADPPQ